MSATLIQRTTLLALLAVAVFACDPGDRPDAAEWLPAWEEILAVIPGEAELGDPADENLCQNTLALIREHSESLIPAPTATLHDLANEWVGVAETTFFECPPKDNELDSFAAAYAELARIEESVATALEEPGG